MKIVVIHMTRMQPGFCCVAGIEAGTGKHVRPQLGKGNRLKVDVLARCGGLFDIGREIDLGVARHIGEPPEVEDHSFMLASAKVIRTLEKDEFWKLLAAHAKATFCDIFGPELHKCGLSAAVDEKKGMASLGIFAPSRPPKLYLDKDKEGKEKIRMKLGDGKFFVDASVTDVRLYNDDYTPKRELVYEWARKIPKAPQLLLGVGLTRPFASAKGQPAVHWMQVNNIHMNETFVSPQAVRKDSLEVYRKWFRR